MFNLQLYKQDMLPCACNPNTQEVEAGEPRAQGHPWLHIQFQASLGYRNPQETLSQTINLWPPGIQEGVGDRLTCRLTPFYPALSPLSSWELDSLQLLGWSPRTHRNSLAPEISSCLHYILAISLEMPQPAYPRDSDEKNQDVEEGVFVWGFDKISQPSLQSGLSGSHGK